MYTIATVIVWVVYSARPVPSSVWHLHIIINHGHYNVYNDSESNSCAECWPNIKPNYKWPKQQSDSKPLHRGPNCPTDSSAISAVTVS